MRVFAGGVSLLAVLAVVFIQFSTASYKRSSSGISTRTSQFGWPFVFVTRQAKSNIIDGSSSTTWQFAVAGVILNSIVLVVLAHGSYLMFRRLSSSPDRVKQGQFTMTHMCLTETLIGLMYVPLPSIVGWGRPFATSNSVLTNSFVFLFTKFTFAYSTTGILWSAVLAAARIIEREQ